jgi:polygalacturonase
VRDLTIYVDVYAQKQVYSHFNALDVTSGLPIFPLNTDGIDPSGANVLIDNVTITNYDDAVAVKPMNANGVYSSCSQNMTIRNSVVHASVGLTIGSVPPDVGVNCVRNITFENNVMYEAIKGVYVKSNPGDVGSGIITDITYRNLTVDGSLWYPIWIGPQQEQQPGTKGTGCSFLYPIVKECPTNPRVSITNITLENVSLTGGVTLPGVILCDPTTQCTGFVFENVTNTGAFLVQSDYVCANAHGVDVGNTPSPGCF